MTSLKFKTLGLIERAAGYCCERRWDRLSSALQQWVFRLNDDRFVFHTDDYGCPQWPVCDYCGHTCDCLECEEAQRKAQEAR